MTGMSQSIVNLQDDSHTGSRLSRFGCCTWVVSRPEFACARAITPEILDGATYTRPATLKTRLSYALLQLFSLPTPPPTASDKPPDKAPEFLRRLALTISIASILGINGYSNNPVEAGKYPAFTHLAFCLFMLMMDLQLRPHLPLRRSSPRP